MAVWVVYRLTKAGTLAGGAIHSAVAFRFWEIRFKFEGLGRGVEGLGLRFRVWGLGFRV